MKNSSVVFLPVPPSLEDDIRHYAEAAFEVDPSILIPLELDGGAQLIAESLSWETILSGMLTIISAAAQTTAVSAAVNIKQGEIYSGSELAGIPPEWVDYYRRFVHILAVPIHFPCF